MQQVLPTSLDMTSAQVLGFDATAYITDTPSTLHQRLNIPATFNASDCFVSGKASAPKVKKNPLPTVAALLASVAGFTFLGYLAFKGKIKLPQNVANVANIATQKASGALSSLGNTFKNAFCVAKSVIQENISKLKK